MNVPKALLTIATLGTVHPEGNSSRLRNKGE
jgi:hypothetical protein